MVLYRLVFPEERGSSGRVTGQAAPGEHGGGPEAGPRQGPRLPGGHAQQVSRLLTRQTGRTHPQVEPDIREGGGAMHQDFIGSCKSDKPSMADVCYTGEIDSNI